MEYPAADTNHDGQCTIGYQNIFAAIPALMVQQKGAAEQAAKLGCKFIALDDQLNPTTQVNNFNQLLAQHADAIVVFPLVPEALGPSVAKAKAAGVHVVANSTPPDAADPLPDGYETRVLQGFDMVAYLRAKYIAENHPGAKVVVMGLAQPVAGLQYFSKRAAYWADRFGLDVLGEVDVQQDNQSSASTAMTQVFSKYPDVEAIFAYNDNTALAAGLAAKAAGKDVAICGNNGQVNVFKGIKDGTVACTALLDAHSMGVQEALGAYDLIAGTEVPDTLTAKETLVTKDNVDSLTPVG
jgi:ribose transport system substrate-binding protein